MVRYSFVTEANPGKRSPFIMESHIIAVEIIVTFSFMMRFHSLAGICLLTSICIGFIRPGANNGCILTDLATCGES